MTVTETEATADAFVERLFDATLGAMDVWAVVLGEQLGWYRALADRGPLTSGQLAAATQTDPRYAREWLEQQTTTGILEVDDPALPAGERRYTLPAAHAEVLNDADSLRYFAPFLRLICAAGAKLPELIAAYRSGGGVSWADLGSSARTGQADANRPWFLHALGTEWFPAVEDLHERLSAGGRVADVGCGEGWSSIGIAKAYPGVTVHGFDVDEPSIEAARKHAEQAGVADRVQFNCVDAATLDIRDEYDVVTAFECIHDLPQPVEVLAAMRGLARADGHVIVMDEAVGDRFSGEQDEVERLMYGFSLLACLPDAMSHRPTAATGTVIRPDTLRGYAREAGFTDIEVLPIQNDLWRFYRLNL